MVNDRVRDVILISSQSWIFVFRGAFSAGLEMCSPDTDSVPVMETVSASLAPMKDSEAKDLRDWLSSSGATEGAMAGEPISVVVSVAEVVLDFAMRAAFFFCSSAVSFSTGRSLTIFSVAVGRRAETVKVQSSWFCWNRLWMLWKAHSQLRAMPRSFMGEPYFSRATRSLIICFRASLSFEPIYCTATYPAPTIPKPRARLVRCRLRKLRVDWNIGGNGGGVLFPIATCQRA